MNTRTTIKSKSIKIAQGFKYAFEGILSAVKKEKNMKIHIIFMFLVIIAGFIFKISLWEWTLCIFLFGAVISCEMMNTAIEIIINMVMPYKNKKAKLAKDVAAGAVLVLAIASALIGLIIFVPKIILFL